MRPRATLPANNTDTDELTRQVRQWAAILGFRWTGPGGAFRLPSAGLEENGAACWRVYSEWAGTGVTADIDAQSGELLAITDADYETVGEPLQVPASLMATPGEAANFVRARLAQIGWQLAEHIDASWDRERQIWLVTAKTAGGGCFIQAQAMGKSGRLRIIEVAAKQATQSGGEALL